MKTEIRNDKEQRLLRSFINGDESAIATLIEGYRKKVYNYILMLVKDRQTADDLCQETFIKVIGSLRGGKYAENGKFISWVLRIAHNQVIDFFRGGRRPAHVTSEDAGYDVLNNKELADPTVEDRMIRDQLEEDVRSLIDRLPEEQREVVVLRHYFDLSFKEIAQQTGVSINTALGRMRYALINLRKLVDERRLAFA
ncbi:sigma-70 family RNA polymerase sigma factor [uncultured Rikenella sp.]|uniref:RNA polymerase sigma factor n=2 Tax=uncultured Rikenella sp. TaxID=368003 RepID=UPI0025EA371E|nr:sigma-70 family RNA polymerase sigma factor [uncultured Rikenella sp.]